MTTIECPKAGDDYPFLHVGHGISAARKSWGLIVVLRDPLPERLKKISAPEPLTATAKVGKRWISLDHDCDSLQWVVAAVYPNPGPRADHGEATEQQWQAFNDDIDATLQRIHKRWPIGAVIRPIDDEYGTKTSPWHEQSMADFPDYLPFLADAGKRVGWYLEHACWLWADWLSHRPLAEQQQRLAALTPAQRKVLKHNGGVPKPTQAPEEVSAPTLDEQLSAWRSIAPHADPFTAFVAAMAPHEWDLYAFHSALLHLEDPSAEHRELLLDLQRRALAAPSCRWPDTHWRPYLVDSLVALNRLDEAREELGRVALGANSYTTANWATMISYLDACERTEDADALYGIASRYVVGFASHHSREAGAFDRPRASRVLLELADPVLGNPLTHDAEALNHAAFIVKDLVDNGLVDTALLDQAGLLQAAALERQAHDFHTTATQLAAGTPTDTKTLQCLLHASYSHLAAEDVHQVVTAALNDPNCGDAVASFINRNRDLNREAVEAGSLAFLNSALPSDPTRRTNWLYTANNILVITHGAGAYELSAHAADTVVAYAAENPYITHSAACSYAAVGRFDDALAQVKLAVELDYDHLDRLRSDTDLGPLLDNPEFQALFAH
jgi:tetratricopeptide (TPR) repeat protein